MTLEPESLGRVRLRGILLLAATFLAGAAGGAAAERVRATRQADARLEARRADFDGRRPGMAARDGREGRERWEGRGGRDGRDGRDRFGPGGPGGPGGPRRGMLPPPYGALDLSAEQRERIAGILEKSRPRSDSILRESLPKLEAVMESVRAEIRTVLTAEQQARLDSMPHGDRRGRGGRGGFPMGGGGPRR